MNQSAPFFSIVMPTYNRAHLILATIKSVTDQTLKDWELIIVDDGSKDNTKEVVESLNDLRIRYIYQSNAERSAARNNGIKNARGQYICFLDSDDAYAPDHLSGLHQFIISLQTSECLIFVDQKVVEHGILVNTNYQSSKIEKQEPLFFLVSSIVPGRVCIAKSIFDTYVFDIEINYGEDADLWFRISCRYPCLHLPQHTFLYHMHEDNSVNVKKFNAFYFRQKGLERIFSKPEASIISAKQRNEIFSNNYFGIIRHYQATYQIWQAWKTTLIALLKYPTHRVKEKVYLLIQFTPIVKTLLSLKYKRAE